MCEVSEPTVRRGVVLKFEGPDCAGAFRLTTAQADQFAEHLASNANGTYVAALEAAFSKLKSDGLVEADAELNVEQDEAELFSNRPNVVRLPDASFTGSQRKLILGCSATVCQDDGQSKVWVRVSEKLDKTGSDVASIRLEQLSVVSEMIVNAMADMYYSLLKKHAGRAQLPEPSHMSFEHVFHIEATDYDSPKLFDTVRTLRDTSNFFTLVDRKNWGPVRDLFTLANKRFDKSSGFQEHTEHVEPTREFISGLTKYFNETDTTVTWDVTLGRHGLFAVDEITPDPRTGVNRTHMVGICADHGNARSTYDTNLTSSWLVSGQMAPKLGAFF